MSKKIRWITETAALLALLVVLQALTKPMGQFVTGTCVNCILAVTALHVGMSSGVAIGLISPVFAFALGIAPNIVTVLPIMVGNICYVLLLCLISGKSGHSLWRQGAGLAIAAIAKFGALYLLVVKIICGVAAGALLGQKIGSTVVLAAPMLEKLPAMFSWPQLITALLGGVVALLVTPALRKALHK